MAALVIATAPTLDQRTSALLWRQVAGRPLVAWPLDALSQLDALAHCALVVPVEHADEARALLASAAPTPNSLVIATDARDWRDAIAAGLASVPPQCDWIILLDAAYPMTSAAQLRAGLLAATHSGVTIAAEPVKETLKRTHDQRVIETPPRAELVRLLSPTIFQRARLDHALATPPADDGDLIALAQRAGAPLVVFAADALNAHVRDEHDLAIVDALLSQRHSEVG